jgi:hypothetical protein
MTMRFRVIDSGHYQRQTHQLRIREVISNPVEHIVRCVATLENERLWISASRFELLTA